MRSAIYRVFLAWLGAAAFSLAAAAQSESEADPAGPPETLPRTPGQTAPPGGSAAAPGRPAKEFPDFKDVAKDYEKVVSTPDGRSFYNIWIRKKDGQMLAELSRSYEGQRIFIAYTVAGGIPTAGEQVGDMYAYWKRYDKRLALMQPNLSVRTTGDLESKKAHGRVFTDRVILDVPIVCMGPGGGPVIDMGGRVCSSAIGRPACRGACARSPRPRPFPRMSSWPLKCPCRGGAWARFTTPSAPCRRTPGTRRAKPILASVTSPPPTRT